MAAMHHLDEEEMEQYSMGLIPEDQCEGLEDHLLICEACRTGVSEHDHYFGAMRAASAEIRVEPVPRRAKVLFLRLAPLAAAASLFLVLWLTGSRLAVQRTAPAFAVDLHAMRGESLGTQAPPGRPLTVHLDVTALRQAAFRVEAVDAVGRAVWKGPAAASQGSPDSTITVVLPPLTPDIYFVRIYSAAGVLLREYELNVNATP